VLESGATVPLSFYTLLYSVGGSEMSASKGMTLIEVVIVVAIVALFLGAVSGLLINFLWSSTTGENYLTASRQHEKVMRVITEELLQTSANMVVPKFWILDENDNPITYELGLEKPGVKIRFRKFTSFSLVLVGSLTVGKSAFDTEVECYRDADTNCVMRHQRQWDPVGGVWGQWSNPPQIIGSCCEGVIKHGETEFPPLLFTELPLRRIKVEMKNEVGDPNRTYGQSGVTAVSTYLSSSEVTPGN
jgi:prepilin-type N-terminal cleavage/methylation domain-containing protein